MADIDLTEFPVGSEERKGMISQLARQLRAHPHYFSALEEWVSRAARCDRKLRSLHGFVNWLAWSDAFLAANGIEFSS